MDSMLESQTSCQQVLEVYGFTLLTLFPSSLYGINFKTMMFSAAYSKTIRVKFV